MTGADAFLAFERDVHDRIAEGYHARFTPVTERAHPLLLATTAVGAGDRLLDVATGPGLLAGKAARLGAVVTGIDLSPRMIAVAARNNAAPVFQVADAQNLAFADASFDVVLCSFGIGHFPQPHLAFAEFARVLAPGGRLGVAWWDRPEHSRINGVFFDALRDEAIRPPATLPPGPDAFHFSDDGTLVSAFVDAGFSRPTIASERGEHILPDFEALWSLAENSFARLGTIIAGLGQDERARLRSAVAARAMRYGAGPLAIPIAFKVAAGHR